MTIALAISLAVIGSLCNAWASILQHDAVEVTLTKDDDTSRRISVRRMLVLLRTPRWLVGVTMIALGAVFHIVAITLAPITLVQPVGVLAVVFTIVMAARQRRFWPGSRVWLGAVTTIVGLGVFVACASRTIGHGSTDLPDSLVSRDLWWAVVVLAVVTVLFAGLGMLGPSWLRCLSWAAACATLFGLASALMRTLTLLLRVGHGWLTPAVVGVLATMAVAYGAGGWLAQQAYASGPPEIVISCLTVLDPLVAVTFGLVVLREGLHIDLVPGVVMALFAALATVGVLVLTRHHPDVVATRTAPRTAEVTIGPRISRGE